ncbi:MAG: elongation factor P [Chloroflexota bacterium]|nr:MAG: elongation factor P [Chloroflexota bacterium]
MITTGELKKGVTIELDGKLYQVLDYQHIKMGRGSAQVRLRLKDIRAGHIIERTFQAGDKFTRARLEQRPAQYLYTDGDLYHFMDTENFEQTALGKDVLGDAVSYLKDEMVVQLLKYGEEPIGVDLPITVDLKVVQTDPGFKGDTATGGNKPAQLETGLTVNVPLFVNTGDVIRVDTRTGQYIERVIS